MRSEFVKEFKIYDKNENEQDEELLNYIEEVRGNLQNMHNNLELADSELIDYYTYLIKAEESKYSYLIKQAKKKNLFKE